MPSRPRKILAGPLGLGRIPTDYGTQEDQPQTKGKRRAHHRTYQQGEAQPSGLKRIDGHRNDGNRGGLGSRSTH